MSAVLRFLRFQAPWTYGRKLFALLRRALVENWANVRHRLMDVTEKRRIRGESTCPARRKMQPNRREERCSRSKRWVWRHCCLVWRWRQAGLFPGV